MFSNQTCRLMYIRGGQLQSHWLTLHILSTIMVICLSVKMGFEAAAEMSKLNLGSRISQGHAANLETYNAPSLTQPLVRGRDNRKAAMFNSIKMLSVPADYKVGVLLLHLTRVESV